jgi:hypothetical protein
MRLYSMSAKKFFFVNAHAKVYSYKIEREGEIIDFNIKIDKERKKRGERKKEER